MTFKHTFQTSITGILTNKTRAALTILGVVIGVTAVILVMSLGGSAKGLIIGKIGALGTNIVVVQPGGNTGNPAAALLSHSITTRDYDAILNKSNVPHLEQASPMVMVPSNASYKGNYYTPAIVGLKASVFLNAFDVRPARGSLFSKSDTDAKAKVAVIGSKVKNELFGPSPALGHNITIKGQKFRIVGVFAPKGQVSFFNIDEAVLLPYTSAQTYLLGTNYYDQIIMRATSPQDVEKLAYEVTQTLRDTHDIARGEDDDFQVNTQKNLMDQLSIITDALTYLLAGMLGISLIVGGIGIMNIMLVSVTERTKEIGLRKALGATRKDITNQFLYESVLLTGTGGVVGTFIALILAYLVALIIQSKTALTDWAFVFPISAVVVGVGVSVFIGLVFGIYPAKKAAEKSPIEALRYE